MRSRISSGSFSSPTRAPNMATSFTTSGAGVATRHQQPQQHGKQKSAESADLQQEGMAGMEMANDAIRQKEDHHRSGGQRHQPNIDAAMQASGASGRKRTRPDGPRSRRTFQGPDRRCRSATRPGSCRRLGQCILPWTKLDASRALGGRLIRRFTTDEPPPTVRAGLPALADCAASWAGPRHVPLSCAQSPDDYSAPKDAPG